MNIVVSSDAFCLYSGILSINLIVMCCLLTPSSGYSTSTLWFHIYNYGFAFFFLLFRLYSKYFYLKKIILL